MLEPYEEMKGTFNDDNASCIPDEIYYDVEISSTTRPTASIQEDQCPTNFVAIKKSWCVPLQNFVRALST